MVYNNDSLAVQAAREYGNAALTELDAIFPVTSVSLENPEPSIVVPDLQYVYEQPGVDSDASPGTLDRNVYVPERMLIAIGTNGLGAYALGDVAGRAQHHRANPSIWDVYVQKQQQHDNIEEQLREQQSSERAASLEPRELRDEIQAMYDDVQNKDMYELSRHVRAYKTLTGAIGQYSGLYLANRWEESLPAFIRSQERRFNYSSLRIGRILFEEQPVSVFHELVSADLEKARELLLVTTGEDIAPFLDG